MNNEPVAWIKQGKYGKPTIVQNPLYQFSYQAESVKQPDIPLYTHPVKEQLTEEQVIDITKTFFNIHPETNLTEKFNIPLYELTHFARAILRKAQEK